jgi:uncharacterized protein YxeA
MKKIHILIILVIVIILGTLFSYNKFIKTYTVTYLNEDGTVYKEFEVVNNKITSENDAESKDGYYFEGWYFENQKFDFSKGITSDVKLTPIYLSYLENVEYETIIVETKNEETGEIEEVEFNVQKVVVDEDQTDNDSILEE